LDPFFLVMRFSSVLIIIKSSKALKDKNVSDGQGQCTFLRCFGC